MDEIQEADQQIVGPAGFRQPAKPPISRSRMSERRGSHGQRGKR
jgi:hypothetical protein